MPDRIDIEGYLDRWVSKAHGSRDVADTILGLVAACREIAALVRKGPLSGKLGELTGRKSGVDPQKEIDIVANDLVRDAMRAAPVQHFASEEVEEAVTLAPGAPLAVAVDPIDGSSNVDANIPLGTIFTILPVRGVTPDASFRQPGSAQLGAGFVVYGPYTSLVMTVGMGTQIFTHDPDSGRFIRTVHSVGIPPITNEYAINTSNIRHWEQCVRIYVDDLVRGREGPRGKDFNMRWTATPVADLYRILNRGGIFLYPGDRREGYALGRLRLVYEANPIAFVVEQAGGAATNGLARILDIEPASVHQRTPIFAGSKAEVDYVTRLHSEPHGPGELSPLFGRRGLFRT
ncbi:MAG: class 1 fructose-bisphosphatase [Hyphomicrobium sp.]|nr:class 1 fructose-bisphosphatase [Hyphomicrobium sp.]